MFLYNLDGQNTQKYNCTQPIGALMFKVRASKNQLKAAFINVTRPSVPGVGSKTVIVKRSLHYLLSESGNGPRSYERNTDPATSGTDDDKTYIWTFIVDLCLNGSIAAAGNNQIVIDFEGAASITGSIHGLQYAQTVNEHLKRSIRPLLGTDKFECMDHFGAVIEVAKFDKITLFGADGTTAEITAAELAMIKRTITDVIWYDEQGRAQFDTDFVTIPLLGVTHIQITYTQAGDVVLLSNKDYEE